MAVKEDLYETLNVLAIAGVVIVMACAPVLIWRCWVWAL
jgi:hypothetical protein